MYSKKVKLIIMQETTFSSTHSDTKTDENLLETANFFPFRETWWNKEYSKTNTGAFTLPEQKVLVSIFLSASIVIALFYYLYRYYYLDRENDWVSKVLQYLRNLLNNLKKSRKVSKSKNQKKRI